MPSNDPASPSLTLTISANIEELLGLLPAGLSLGDVERGQTLTQTFELTGKLAAEVKLSEVKAPEHLAIQMKELKEGDKRRVELTVTVSKDAPTETMLNGRVEIKTDQAQMEWLRVNLRARVVGSITVQPPRVQARARQVNEAVNLKFNVAARNGKGFKVLSVADEAGRFNGVARPSPDDKRYEVEVVVPANLVSRSFSGVVVVKTNDAETPELKVPYSIVVHAGAGRMNLDRSKMPLDKSRLRQPGGPGAVRGPGVRGVPGLAPGRPPPGSPRPGAPRPGSPPPGSPRPAKRP